VIRRRVYPGNYDRSQWEAHQSDNEHQQMPVPAPYDNSYQGDIASLGYDTLYEQQALDAAAASGSNTSGASPGPGQACDGAAYVRYGWDSRPIAARDGWSNGYASVFPAATDQDGTLTVPQGMIAIVRTITFTPSAYTGPVIDQRGLALQNYMISVLINGLPTPGFTLIDVGPGFPSGGEIECFIMCQPGDRVTGFASFGGVQVDGGNVLTIPCGFRFWATFLPNDGRNLPEQAGNMLAAPVCLNGATIAQIKPPPLIVPTENGPVVVSQAAANPAPVSGGGRKCPQPPLVSVNTYLACVTSIPSEGL